MPDSIPENIDTVVSVAAFAPSFRFPVSTLRAVAQNIVAARTRGLEDQASVVRGAAFQADLAAALQNYLQQYPDAGVAANIPLYAEQFAAIDEQWHQAAILNWWERFDRGSVETPPPGSRPDGYIKPSIVSGPGALVIPPNSTYTPDGKVVGKKSTTTTSLVVAGAPVWEAGTEAVRLGIVDGQEWTDEFDTKWIAEWHSFMIGGALFFRKA